MYDETWKVIALQKECKRFGLHYIAKKVVLIQRLNDHIASVQTETRNEEETDELVDVQVRYGVTISTITPCKPADVLQPDAQLDSTAQLSSQLPEDQPLFSSSQSTQQVLEGLLLDNHAPVVNDDELLQELLAYFVREAPACNLDE